MQVVVQKTPFPQAARAGARDVKNSGRQTFVQKSLVESGFEYPSVRMIFAHSFRERSAMAPRYTVATKKAPNPIDQHVGSRVRMRRMMLAMGQQALGAALGLTFQQVQKYEKGTNCIGASRLQQISHILQVPVAFFFEGMASMPTTAAAPNASAPHGSNGSALSTVQIDDFVSSSDGLRLIGAFMRIDNAAVRRRIVMIVQEIAGDDGN